MLMPSGVFVLVKLWPTCEGDRQVEHDWFSAVNTNIFCAGHAFALSGNLLMVEGHSNSLSVKATSASNKNLCPSGLYDDYLE